MDPRKLGVDESQISKTTGRIILPDEESQRLSQRAQVPRPRPVGVPNTSPTPVAVQPPVTESSEVPSAVSTRHSPGTQLHAVVIAVLAFLVILQTLWLFWSHSQSQSSIRQMHDQVIKLSSDLASFAEAIKSLSREVLEIKVLLARTGEEQKNQARVMAEIRKQLQEMDVDSAPSASATAPR